MYGLLRLTRFQVCPSKWAYEGQTSWRMALDEIGLKGGILMTGSALLLGSTSATTLPDRFLPATSCSTLALLFLLLRWAHLAVCRHGLRPDASRLIEGSLLDGFIHSLFGSLKEGPHAVECGLASLVANPPQQSPTTATSSLRLA